MTCHYPDLGSASDWLKRNSLGCHFMLAYFIILLSMLIVFESVSKDLISQKTKTYFDGDSHVNYDVIRLRMICGTSVLCINPILSSILRQRQINKVYFESKIVRHNGFWEGSCCNHVLLL